jgi:hypothetical protein
MPAFQQAVIGSKDKSTSAQVLKCIVSEGYKVDNLTRNVIQRARKIVCDNDDLGVLHSYLELATFLSLVENRILVLEHVTNLMIMVDFLDVF